MISAGHRITFFILHIYSPHERIFITRSNFKMSQSNLSLEREETNDQYAQTTSPKFQRQQLVSSHIFIYIYLVNAHQLVNGYSTSYVSTSFPTLVSHISCEKLPSSMFNTYGASHPVLTIMVPWPSVNPTKFKQGVLLGAGRSCVRVHCSNVRSRQI